MKQQVEFDIRLTMEADASLSPAELRKAAATMILNNCVGKRARNAPVECLSGTIETMREEAQIYGNNEAAHIAAAFVRDGVDLLPECDDIDASELDKGVFRFTTWQCGWYRVTIQPEQDG